MKSIHQILEESKTVVEAINKGIPFFDSVGNCLQWGSVVRDENGTLMVVVPHDGIAYAAHYPYLPVCLHGPLYCGRRFIATGKVVNLTNVPTPNNGGIGNDGC